MIKLNLKRIAPRCEKTQSWTNMDGTKRHRTYIREWAFEEILYKGIGKKMIYDTFKSESKNTKFLKRLTVHRRISTHYTVWRYVGQPDVYIMGDGFYVDENIYHKYKEQVEYAVYRAFKIVLACHLIDGVEEVVCETKDINEDKNGVEDSSLFKRLKFLTGGKK